MESNPEVLEAFASGAGFTAAAFHDVYGFDDELLAMVPSPCRAVLMLFPIDDASEKAKAEEEKAVAESGQPELSPEVWFTRQTVGNACGTVGVLHAVANSGLDVALGSPLDAFFGKARELDPEGRARLLEEDDSLEAAHGSAAAEGQTAAPSVEESVNTHFVCFSCVGSGLVELDGRRTTPVYRGPTTPETLLKDAVQVIKQYVERAGEEGANKFSLVAVA